MRSLTVLRGVSPRSELTSIAAGTNSIIEGTKKCLERLQMDYVDVIFAHRPDHTGMCRVT